MKILITNDDGWRSPLLTRLCRVLSSAHDIAVVAPELEQSGVSHAFSYNKALVYHQVKKSPYPVYSVSGSPADCVKFAVCHIFKANTFDLVVSGINPGENAGLSAIYSGTVAAAREGALWGIPAMALSVWNDTLSRASLAAQWLKNLLQSAGVISFEKGAFWNVNFPDCEAEDLKGTVIADMSSASFEDDYVMHLTPRGFNEYWLRGAKRKSLYRPRDDDKLLRMGYITITPLQVSQVCPKEKKRLALLKNKISTELLIR